MSTDKLPDGWTRVKFGDVVRNVNENSRDLASDGVDHVVGLDHLDPGSLRLIRWDNLANLPDGTTFTRKFKPGQVLFGKRRAYQRKVAVPDFAGVCSGDILVFEPADKRMLAEFLPYLVQSDGFFDHALGTSAGSLSPRTKWAELAKYEFALPPVEEQRKIVEVLAQAESAVKKTSRAVLVAKNSLILMSIQLTRPAGSPSVPLEDVAEVLNSRRVPVNDAERSKRIGSVPYYGANGQVGLIDTAIFNEPLVLVPEDGGRFSEWRNNPVAYRIDGPSWVNNHAHVLKAKGIPHGWLYFSLRNLDMTHLVVGSTRTKLNRSALSKIEIAVPGDLASRLALLERVDAVRAEIESHLENAKRILSELRNKLVSPGGHGHVQ